MLAVCLKLEARKLKRMIYESALSSLVRENRDAFISGVRQSVDTQSNKGFCCSTTFVSIH